MRKEHRFVTDVTNMRLLKWAAVLMPALLFVFIDVIWRWPSGDDGRNVFEFVWIHAVITVVIIVISYIINTFINRLQTSLIQANRDSAIVQERERTAREMHDGMAQLLGYINTQTIAVRTLLSKGQLSEAREELTKMEEIARDLYADVREAILGLRVVPKREGGLIPSLREYAELYAEMSGIKVGINVATDTHFPKMDPSAEIQLIRIVQESLTNVRKHAKATATVITFKINGDELFVTIADNGRGFDMNNLSPGGQPRFGLQIMKERAKAINGSFSIEASPGKGCQVSVHVPLSLMKQNIGVGV